jgi:hypothetical protein
MNPKVTEFLAQDRIATFHAEAAGQHVEKRRIVSGSKAPDGPATRRLIGVTVVWHRIRHVGAG